MPPPAVRVGSLDEWLTAQLDAALDGLARELADRGCTLEPTAERHGDLRLVLTGDGEGQSHDPSGHHQEAYQLTVGAAGVDLTAHSAVGLYRGLTTLTQWLRLFSSQAARNQPGEGQPIGGVEIVDWPDIAKRGLMLDVSRNRVPRMAQLYALVDLMSELKLNHLQLYFEHTFAYVGHETVWQHSSPLEPAEVRRLESYARRRFVELTPNQNSFGHMHRWLIHEPYRQLAECPDGIEHPFSPEVEPFGLCPTDPRSLDLLGDLYAQLLPNFASELVNIGFDEALDLGRCRSRQTCEQVGKGRLYLDFLRQVVTLASEHGKRSMFWADMVLDELADARLGADQVLEGLPRKSIAMIWGYEPGHDFKQPLTRLSRAGLEAWVCPGTASWNSFTGRAAAARTNLAAAARQSDGAGGYLITDWGDHGHLQPPPVSWPAYVAGACFAWNRLAAGEPEKLAQDDLLDLHVLRDPARKAGRALLDLADAQELTGVQALNGAPLFFAWFFADKPTADRRGAGFSAEGLEAAFSALRDALAALGEARMERADADLILQEAQWAADAAKLGGDLALARLTAGEETPVEALPEAERKKLASSLDGLIERLPPIWLARSRRGGLDGSITRLTRLKASL